MMCTRHGSYPACARFLRPLIAFVSVCLLTAAPCAAQPQPGAKHRFTIGNQTKYLVDEIRLSPGGENKWGPDHTGIGDLKPDQVITIADLAPGQYDVKFIDDGGNACILKSIPVFSEMSWNITAAFISNCAGFGQGRVATAEKGHRLTVKNNARLAVLEIRASPTGTNQWGPDRTGDTTLRPGGTVVLKDLAAAPYDLKFVVESGDSCILKSINAADQPAWSLTMPWLRSCSESGAAARSALPSGSGFRFTVVNNLRYSVHEVRMSPAGANKWGPDRAGDMEVKAGDSLILKNVEAGQYDVKFVDENGNQCILKDVQIAGHQSWNLTMQWLRNCEAFGRGRSAAQK